MSLTSGKSVGDLFSYLAQAARVPASYLCEIEAGRSPGSFQAMAAIAAALRIDMEDLKPWPQA